MRSVDVGVRHDDDAVVAQLAEVLLGADAGAERGDERRQLLRRQHAIEAHLLDVQDLALERQDRLKAAVAALLGRAAGALTLDDEQLALARVALLTVGQLARQRRHLERTLALHQLAGLARGLAGLGRQRGLADHHPRFLGMALEELAEPIGHHRADRGADLARHQLVLGLVRVLRIGDLHRDDRGEALAQILARQRGALGVLAEELVLGGVGVDRAGQRLSEPGEVRPAVAVLDRVGEADELLVVALVPLQRDVDDDALVLRGERDHVGVHHRVGGVHVGDEGRDAALVAEVLVLLGALVADRDLEAAVEVRELAQLLAQLLEAELGDVLEDGRVGVERHRGAAIRRRRDLLERRHRDAAGVLLLPGVAVAPDLEPQPVGQRVHRRHADAVESARDLVVVLVELAAGVQDRHHQLGGGLALDRVDAGRDAAAVVAHGDRAVDVDRDLDLGAVAGERLVDRVVDDLEHQVVQAAAVIGVADVHAGAFAHALEALQHADGRLGVRAGGHRRLGRNRRRHAHPIGP